MTKIIESIEIMMGLFDKKIRVFTNSEDRKDIPSVHEIIFYLKNQLQIKKTQYYGKTEAEVEKVIAKQLREYYGEINVHQQYSVGGFLNLKCDIDLFDNRCCGIELKLAKQLENSSAKERLIGQAVYYSKRCYQNRLIVLIVGTKNEYDTTMKEVQDFLEEMGVFFIYKETE